MCSLAEAPLPGLFVGNTLNFYRRMYITVQSSLASERVGGGYSALHPLALLVFRGREPRRAVPLSTGSHMAGSLPRDEATAL